FLCSTIRREPTPPLFPYTTLFRSKGARARARRTRGRAANRPSGRARKPAAVPRAARARRGGACLGREDPRAGRAAARRLAGAGRSEEHTSELQSRFDLVCRLLLEK